MNTQDNITIGIDKTTLKGFQIVSIDVERLLSNTNTTLIREQENRVVGGILIPTTSGSEIPIEYLKITDGFLFNVLYMATKIIRGQVVNYCYINFSIADKKSDTDNNVQPLNMSEYHNKISRVKEYLLTRYGLNIDFHTAQFQTLELNITAQMNYDFKEYEYLLKQMVYLTPKTYKVDLNLDHNRDIREYKFYTSTTEGKIYDKTYQQQDKFKIKLDNQFMRIEYKLLNTQTIERYLGTAYIYSLTDKVIKDWLHSKIYKDLIAPMDKYINRCQRKLKQLIKEQDYSNKLWISHFIDRAVAYRFDSNKAEMPVLLDVMQIKPLILEHIDKSHRARTLKGVDNLIAKKYGYLKNNISKWNEIKRKFQ